jgi:serine/threonine protein kinase
MQPEHPHIVYLLASFEVGNTFNFIFPWANGGTLQTLLQEHPVPRFNEGQLWLAKQSAGLSSALAQIHNPYSYSRESPIYVRDGDIKPANILWFSGRGDNLGTLVVGDFGLATFHTRATMLRSSAMELQGWTEAYRVPETCFPTRCISRAYDIWSFGCVMLELATFILEGPNGVLRFSCERLQEEDGERVLQATFFKLAQPTKGHLGLEIKTSVAKVRGNMRSIKV